MCLLKSYPKKLVSPSVEPLAVKEATVLAIMMQGDKEVRLIFQSNLFLIGGGPPSKRKQYAVVVSYLKLTFFTNILTKTLIEMKSLVIQSS